LKKEFNQTSIKYLKN
jgi:hypothetical protein